MGYYLGTRLPDEFDPDYNAGRWNDLQKMWHCGYEEGFAFGKYWVETEKTERLRRELENLRANFDANLRVAKEEIKKQVLKEGLPPAQETQIADEEFTRFKCNNPECSFEVVSSYASDDEDFPDSDCPLCGWHDSVIDLETFGFEKAPKQVREEDLQPAQES